jgi:hypothetical protein
MELGIDEVEEGRMWKREEVVEAPYPAPKPYSPGSLTVKGCGEWH